MASGIGNWLRAQIDALHISDREFSRRSGIKPSALSYILTQPGVIPTLPTLERIARTLGVDLDVVITISGFTLRGDDATARAERVSRVAEVVPAVQRLLDDTAQLPPKYVMAIQSYVDRVIEEVEAEAKRDRDTP